MLFLPRTSSFQISVQSNVRYQVEVSNAQKDILKAGSRQPLIVWLRIDNRQHGTTYTCSYMYVHGRIGWAAFSLSHIDF